MKELDKIDEKLFHEIIDLYKKGHTQLEISRILDVDIGVVRRGINLGLYKALIKYR